MQGLRALHAIIGQSLDAIERVYYTAAPDVGARSTTHSPSPSPSPSPPRSPSPATPTTPGFHPGEFESSLLPSPFPSSNSLSKTRDIFLTGENALASPPLSPSKFHPLGSKPQPLVATPIRASQLKEESTPRPRLFKSPTTPLATRLVDSPITFAAQTGSPMAPNLCPVALPMTPTTPNASSSPRVEPMPYGAHGKVDFPSLDEPYSPSSPSEALTSHPEVVAAINEIVSACGQLAASVQNPFLTLCDAIMCYHLPSCMRLLEGTHAVELMSRNPEGLHVKEIAAPTGVDPVKLGHVLRLLASHHIIREVAPDVFTTNRISGFMDAGLPSDKTADSNNDVKGMFKPPNSIESFIGLCTDELFKASAYMTDAYLLDPSTRASRDPTKAPFNFAFETPLPFFGWLEEEGVNPNPSLQDLLRSSTSSEPRPPVDPHHSTPLYNNKLRLERFGKAMTGTGQWEVPNAIFNALDWNALAPGSVVVDIGGGIGSSTMSLANEFGHLKFVVQDRPVVVDMGIKAWKERCPKLLESQVTFQKHDFFTPQPVKNASVFFLRVILHDWPDAFAQRILLRLREAAVVAKPDPNGNIRYEEGTRLVLGDFVLPLACVDEFGCGDGITVDGAEKTLAQAPLLANLGKANANAYWMDMTMQVTFNSQERTLRETVALAASAGWKVICVARATGSSFGHVIAVPDSMPVQRRARGVSNASLTAHVIKTGFDSCTEEQDMEMAEHSSSRCGTPTFGSRTGLPSVEEVARRFGGARSRGVVSRGRGRGPTVTTVDRRPFGTTINPVPPKKKTSPSPLAHRLPQSPKPSPPIVTTPSRQRSRTTLMTSPPPRRATALMSPTPLPSSSKSKIIPPTQGARMTPPSPATRPIAVYSPTPIRRRSGSMLPSPPKLLNRARAASRASFGFGLALVSKTVAEGEERAVAIESGSVLGAAAEIERIKR